MGLRGQQKAMRLDSIEIFKQRNEVQKNYFQQIKASGISLALWCDNPARGFPYTLIQANMCQIFKYQCYNKNKFVGKIIKNKSQ